jgi:hypothetical protein
MTKPTQNKQTNKQTNKQLTTTLKLNRNDIIQKFRQFDRPAVLSYAKEHKNSNEQDVDHTPPFITSLDNFLTKTGTSLANLAGHATIRSILKHQTNFVSYMKTNSTMRMRNSSLNRSDNQDRIN